MQLHVAGDVHRRHVLHAERHLQWQLQGQLRELFVRMLRRRGLHAERHLQRKLHGQLRKPAAQLLRRLGRPAGRGLRIVHVGVSMSVLGILRQRRFVRPVLRWFRDLLQQHLVVLLWADLRARRGWARRGRPACAA